MQEFWPQLLLISAAAYRALWQFATAPFKWEKTEHGEQNARCALRLRRITGGGRYSCMN